jgi:hypothetical protein
MAILAMARDGGNPKRLDHLVAEENSEQRPRDEGRGKALRRSLLGMDEGPQQLLVPAKCLQRPALRRRQSPART